MLSVMCDRAYSGSAQAGVESYMERYYLPLSSPPLTAFDISLIALPQLSQQLIVAPYCIFMLYVEISLPHHQFLSQKFGNFKGGGKFVVTIIALIYAYGNLQIYNIIGLYAPYTNGVIFNKIRNNSLWHTLCILMITYNLTQKHKKKFKLKNNFI